VHLKIVLKSSIVIFTSINSKYFSIVCINIELDTTEGKSLIKVRDLKQILLGHTFISYQTVWSYCLSRDCPISFARRLKCRLQKPSQRLTSQQKLPLRNNISPSNIKYNFKITKSLTGDRI